MITRTPVGPTGRRDGSASPPRSLAAVGLVLALGLCACSTRVADSLTPAVATADGTSRVEMLVATTRAATGEPGLPYSGERGSTPRLDHMVISIPPESVRKVGEIQWPTSSPPDPAKSFAVLSDRAVSIPEARTLLFDRGERRRVLVFVHGFNTRYDEAVFRFAQLVHDTGTDFTPVLFTWPSRGSVWAYNYDKESANWSRDTLETLLRSAAADPHVAEVTVMAHSMGSWLAVEALRQLAIHDGAVAPKIRNVILASPDLDVDVFRGQIARLGPKRPHITLFVSRDDYALRLSKRLAGDVDRLGAIDPSTEPYRSILEKTGVTVLDLTALRTGDPLNHGKFAESSDVVQLLGKRLIAGQSVSDARVGLGDRLGAVAVGAADTLGSAAGLAVSAPIAVFDPETRSNLGDRVGRIGTGALGTVDPLTP